MKRKGLLTLVASISLVLIIVVAFMSACAKPAPAPPPAPPPAPAPAPAPAPPAPPKVEWPKDLVAVTPAPKGTHHFIMIGMGPVVEKHTPIEHYIVQPLGGVVVFAPMFKKGEADVANYSAPSCLEAFLGIKDFEKTGPMPVRTLTMGHSYMIMFHTIPETGIRTLADLKGKAVYTNFAGTPFMHEMALNQLASVGLTEADLKASLTYSSRVEAARDLIEGTVDAFIYPVVPSAVKEINEAKGECVFPQLTKEQAEFCAERQPGFFPGVVEAGDPRFANKSEVRWAMMYQAGQYCRADLHPDIVYGILKALLEHHDEWKDCHPSAKYWGLDQDIVTASGRPPYHEGSIRFYKEKGIWTAEAQAYDDELLKKK